MPQIIINHDGDVSNVNAMEACIKFVFDNYSNRHNQDYKYERNITPRNGVFVKVNEVKHENEDKSPCSVVFEVNKLEKKQGPAL